MRPASLRLTVVPGFYFWHSDGCPHGVGRSPTYTVRPDDRGAQSHAGSRPSAPGTSLRQRWLRCPFAELPTCHSGLRLVAAQQFAQQFRLGCTDAAMTHSASNGDAATRERCGRVRRPTRPVLPLLPLDCGREVRSAPFSLGRLSFHRIVPVADIA